MTNIQNSGNILWQAAEVVNRAGHEINALLDLSVQKLTNKINDGKLINVRDYEEGDLDDANASSGWIYINEVRNIKLYPPKVHYPRGVLGLEVVIGNYEEYITITENIPTLNVLFDSSPDGDPGSWEGGINMYRSSTEWTEYFLCGDSRLIIYNEEYCGVEHWNPNIKEWYFSVPLTSINSPEDIDNTIIKPIQYLFENFKHVNQSSDVLETYFNNNSKLIKFQRDNDNGLKPITYQS